MNITHILDKVDGKYKLSKEEAVALLEVDTHSGEFYKLLGAANELSRTMYQNKGYIFAQIGVNSSPCSGNCKFCSLAKDYFSMDTLYDKSTLEILDQVNAINTSKLDALFLMTTADYPLEQYVKIGMDVRKLLDENVHMVANAGDFDTNGAKKIKEAGFDGFYHIVRLREGEDTDLSKEKRIATIEAGLQEGLELYYCVEPIGTEHTYEEIAEEMLRAREYGVKVMAVMGRTSVPGTEFEGIKEVTELEMTKIAAVTRIVTNPAKSMNIHEPKKMALLAGINQLYAEIGVNPRDTNVKTETHRGMGIEACCRFLEEAEYMVNL